MFDTRRLFEAFCKRRNEVRDLLTRLYSYLFGSNRTEMERQDNLTCLTVISIMIYVPLLAWAAIDWHFAVDIGSIVFAIGMLILILYALCDWEFLTKKKASKAAFLKDLPEDIPEDILHATLDAMEEFMGPKGNVFKTNIFEVYHLREKDVLIITDADLSKAVGYCIFFNERRMEYFHQEFPTSCQLDILLHPKPQEAAEIKAAFVALELWKEDIQNSLKIDLLTPCSKLTMVSSNPDTTFGSSIQAFRDILEAPVFLHCTRNALDPGHV